MRHRDRPAIPRAKASKKWRRIAIRRYGCVVFVPHANYLIIGSNFCQALVANGMQEIKAGNWRRS
jgi:hypothetical protein